MYSIINFEITKDKNDILLVILVVGGNVLLT